MAWNLEHLLLVVQLGPSPTTLTLLFETVLQEIESVHPAATPTNQ